MMHSPRIDRSMPIVCVAFALTALLGPAAAQAAPGGQPKQDVCHRDGKGRLRIINVAAAAVPAHLGHGDILPLIFFADNDGDGFGAGASFQGCEIPGGFSGNGDDCDDTNGSVNPAASELCNGIDDNCAGGIDEGLDFDLDSDGFHSLASCHDPLDCNDNDSAVNPAALEICNGIDDNCAGGTDEGLDFDLDTDGFNSLASCQDPVDCDDDDASINPGAGEICNGVDDNCSGEVDEGLDFDFDLDLFNSTESCQEPVDCDDGNSSVNPDASEICANSIDDDCDGDIDGDDDDCAPINSAPVAVDDNFIQTAVACVLDSCAGTKTCTLNAAPGTLTANDLDPEGDSFDSIIDGDIIAGGWSCNAAHICTTDSGFIGGSSTLTVNPDGSFDLTYVTTQQFIFGGPADIVIAEFLYRVKENATPEMFQSTPARVMVPVYPPVCN